MIDERKQAQAILSDPNFDVQEYVKNINLHFSNPEITKALGTNPHIVLGLVKSGEYGFLETCPNLIDPSIFEKMHEEGHEVWTKKEKAKSRLESQWWGVVYDDLAMLYRAIGNKYNHRISFEVQKIEKTGHNTLKKITTRWKNRGMDPVGQERAVPKVNQVRQNIIDYMEAKFTLKEIKYWGAKSSEFWAWDRVPDHTGSRYHSVSLNFRVLASGKDHVKVYVHEYKNSNAWVSTGDLTKRFHIDEDDLPFKILNWAVKNGTKNLEFYDNILRFKKIVDSERRLRA